MKTKTIKGFLVLCLFFLFSLSAFCQSIPASPFTTTLWPDLTPEGDASPRIKVYLAPTGKANGAAFVICPGGAYTYLNSEREGDGPAQWLNTLGVAGIVLPYRLGHHPIPMEDGQRAMKVVRAHAAEWGLDTGRIGIMGFSAGGHEASTVGVHFNDCTAKAGDWIDSLSCRPSFMILIYPVISFYLGWGPPTNLVGAPPDQAIMAYLANDRHVTGQTPPTFLAHAADDGLVPPSNSIAFHDSCVAHSVPTELHVYPTGGHGFGDSTILKWAGDGDAWMRRLGIYSSADSSIFTDTRVLDFYATSSGMFPLDPVIRVTNISKPIPALTATPDSSWLRVSVSGSGNLQVMHHSVNVEVLEAGCVYVSRVRLSADGYYSHDYSVTVRAYPRVPVKIEIKPDTLDVPKDGQGRFAANVMDDRLVPVSEQMKIDWVVSGGGTIDSTGRFTSVGDTGKYKVTATLHDFPGVADTALVSVGAGLVSNLSSWAPVNGGWGMIGNGYQGVAGSDDAFSLARESDSNFTYEADIKLVSGSIAALVFRSSGTPANSAYAVNINTAGRIRFYKNPFTSLAVYNTAISNGVWYHLKVEAAGSHFKVYFNNGSVPVMEADDPTYSAGRFGLNVSSATVLFQNVFVNGALLKMDGAPSMVQSAGLTATPNPFNPITTIRLPSPLSKKGRLMIYDLQGKCVADLSGLASKGIVNWNAARFASGVYLLKAETAERTMTKRLLLLQ